MNSTSYFCPLKIVAALVENSFLTMILQNVFLFFYKYDGLLL